MRLTVRNLTVSYQQTTVQESIDFTVKSGHIFIISGQNGCGKSQLLRHLVGLDQPIHGQVLYDDIDLWSANTKQYRAIMRQVGVHYQRGALWQTMTVAQNVALPLRVHTDLPARDIAAIVSLKLALLGIEQVRDRYPTELTDNIKNLVGLARTLALDPRILFFDEPHTGLDPISARHLDQVILQIRNHLHTTVVMVNNDLASIFALGDEMIFLGRVEQTVLDKGSPRQLLHHSPQTSVRQFLQQGNLSHEITS